MQKDTPSINKPRIVMAKIEVCAQNVKSEINALQCYRSGWANDIREGWSFGTQETKDILFQLYEISGSIILALQTVLEGHYRDKMAMIMVKQKLEKLVKSEKFDELAAMSEAGMCHIITTGTKHHIRVMFETLEVLTA